PLVTGVQTCALPIWARSSVSGTRAPSCTTCSSTSWPRASSALVRVIWFVVSRLLQSLVALAILSVVVFILARATGDPLHLILPNIGRASCRESVKHD